MIYFVKNCKIPCQMMLFKLHPRFLNQWPAKEVRTSFVDFFKHKGHKYIPSSPVVPWTDRSLNFINAGINQFKPILCGNPKLYFGDEDAFKTAVNSQKCIRMGGKHNDLSHVGLDSYHHTFFEMLGNWSFGDYFKPEACKLAWELLTKVYNIPPKHLYITYFGGDPSLGISPDEEVKEIWMSLGVPAERILPFGAKDNFWEMESVGPCGVSTEIHYEYKPSSNGASLINTGSPLVVELWNLVFIQFQRFQDGSLKSLSTNNVDTGMGLERLCAILNGKTSNYDIDLFIPLFESIQKMSKKPSYSGNFGMCSLDSAYRIIADHSRMMSIALSDGFLPHDKYILRKSFRRIMNIGRDVFGLDNQKYWLCKLHDTVIESLGETYPELNSKSSVVKSLLQFEEDLYNDLLLRVSKDWEKITSHFPQLKSISDNLSQNLVDGLVELLAKTNMQKSDCPKEFKLDDAMRLHQNFFVPPHLVEEISVLLGFKFNSPDFHKAINRSLNSPSVPTHSIKSENKELAPTFYQPYDYEYNSDKNMYDYHPLDTKILSLITSDAKNVSTANTDEEISVIVDRTNFYYESGGQESDIGTIESNNGICKIKKVISKDGFIMHHGQMLSGTLSINDDVTLKVNTRKRFGASVHHSAHHLFMSALRAVTGVAFQRTSTVTEKGFTLGLFAYPNLEISQIALAEQTVQEWIKAKCPIERTHLPMKSAVHIEKLKLLPDAIYPHLVYMVSSSLKLPPHLEAAFANDVQCVDSCELCCGSHLCNTAHLKDFAITEINFKDFGNVSIQCVCGEKASKLNARAAEIFEQATNWEKTIDSALSKNEKVKGLNKSLLSWRKSIKQNSLPFTTYSLIMMRIKLLEKRLLDVLYRRSNWKNLLREYQEIISKSKSGPIIHVMSEEYTGTQSDLETIIQESSNRPSLFVCRGWGKFRVVALIPKASTEVSIETLLMSIVESVGKGRINTRREDHFEIGDIFINGVKFDDIDPLIHNVVSISKQFLSSIQE